MKKWGLLIFIVLFVGGCSENDEIEQLTIDHQKEVEALRKEIEEDIEESKEEIEKIKADNNLQTADYNSREIMRLISEGKFEELRNEYQIDFEVKDGEILFAKPEGNLPLRIELTDYLMYIASISNSPDGTDINYFIDDPHNEKSHLINFHFDKDMKFKYLFVGGE